MSIKHFKNVVNLIHCKNSSISHKQTQLKMCEFFLFKKNAFFFFEKQAYFRVASSSESQIIFIMWSTLWLELYVMYGVFLGLQVT